MTGERDENLSDDLLALLGEEDFLRLVEWRGGTRLYVGSKKDMGAIVDALGIEAARKLSTRFSGTVRIPLARERRARKYRADGMTNAQIALRLGITETGVDKLFHRIPRPPRKGRPVDTRQLKLFG